MKACNRIKIEVKARHIKEGVPGSPESCPIALAIEETLRKTKFPSFLCLDDPKIEVDGSVSINGEEAKTSAPAKIEKFVEMFDRTREGFLPEEGERKPRMPKPFSFYIE